MNAHLTEKDQINGATNVFVRLAFMLVAKLADFDR